MEAGTRVPPARRCDPDTGQQCGRGTLCGAPSSRSWGRATTGDDSLGGSEISPLFHCNIDAISMKYPDSFAPFSLGRTIQTNPGRNLDSRSTADRSRCEGGQIDVLAAAEVLRNVIPTGQRFASGSGWSRVGSDALRASEGSRGIAETLTKGSHIARLDDDPREPGQRFLRVTRPHCQSPWSSRSARFLAALRRRLAFRKSRLRARSASHRHGFVRLPSPVISLGGTILKPVRLRCPAT